MFDDKMIEHICDDVCNIMLESVKRLCSIVMSGVKKCKTVRMIKTNSWLP